MTDLIETCPFCHQDCILPEPLKYMKNWPVICHACDMIFEANTQNIPARSAKKAAQTDEGQPHKCVHCHYQMQISTKDFERLVSAHLALSCPNCRETLLISDGQGHKSRLTAALITVIFLAITASLWLILTPEGEEARRYLQPYLALPYQIMWDIKLAFHDLMSFIRGLFLQL